MTDFNRVNDSSDLEIDQSFQPKRSTVKKMAVAVATAMVVCVGILALSTNGFSRNCSNIGALQGKSAWDLDSAIRSTSEKLIQAVKNNQTVADETVMKAMVKAGHKIQDHWEKHHIRKLDTLTTFRKVKGFRQDQKAAIAGRAECAFNVLEAFVSAVGMGDDINAIIRTCPPPRDGESELACQVNGAILGAWVGNLATKLALAASNCALNLNVDAVCSAGITGLVSGLGEIAAGASLGAATCTGTPPQLTTTKISVLGDQTVRDSRRWRRHCGQRSAVWCRCGHGGSQHCKHGYCHQQGRECEQVQSEQVPLTSERVQGHPRVTLHRRHWWCCGLHRSGCCLHQSHCGSLPGLNGPDHNCHVFLAISCFLLFIVPMKFQLITRAFLPAERHGLLLTWHP